MLFIILGLLVSLASIFVLGFDAKRRFFSFSFKTIFGVIPLLVMIVVASVKMIPTGHTGVITTFGAVDDFTLEAGMHFTNPLSNVYLIDNRVQKSKLEFQSFSSDIQEISIEYTINYSIDKANAQNLYKTVGTNYYSTIIEPKVLECVKSVVAKYNAESLISSRSEVALKIEESLKVELLKNNINLVATAIENFDFTDAFTDAVEAKQVAEQNKLRAETEAETLRINAQANADVKLIEAKATSEANELLTQSLTDKIIKQNAIEKWDGKLPTVISDNSNILDLTGLNN